jgi:hypothetical protein
VIIAAGRVLGECRPDASLLLGDTNSSLAAIAAKRRKVPIFHMEAGNRCFDARVPEETNRRIVDHTADVNLPYSTIAREHLLREGLPPDLVIKTGSAMFEVLAHYRPLIDSSTVLERLAPESGGFFVVGPEFSGPQPARDPRAAGEHGRTGGDDGRPLGRAGPPRLAILETQPRGADRLLRIVPDYQMPNVSDKYFGSS